ncbi:MAG: polyphenol oxidase family protein [Elusimicrobia bacterium]|nr:polyphenol oxidase family protein [Elusimicrobiota bacterium]
MTNLYTDKRLNVAGIICGTTARAHGGMADVSRRTTALSELGVNPERMLFTRQAHTDAIVEIHTEKDFENFKFFQGNSDGWILSLSNTGVAIFTADCVPLFLWDSAFNYLGLAHAGWQGVAKNLPLKIAKKLAQTDGVKPPFYAWIGPHIKPCCFEVQEEVSAQFHPSCVNINNGKISIDLGAETQRQLVCAGVSKENIAISADCTCCQSEFFSFRRDKNRSRMISFIYKGMK